MTKQILFDGDVIVEQHIYQGERPYPDSISLLGTRTIPSKGGAHLIYELCRGVCGKKDGDGASHFDMQERDSGAMGDFPSQRSAFAVWSPCRNSSNQKDDKKVWRVTSMLGYGAGAVNRLVAANDQPTDKKDYDILIIDDAALEYRFNKSLWPPCLTDEKAKKPDWIVLKMSHPLCHGDLWCEIRERYQDRLILIASADDLRRGEIMISRGRSWEQTVQDLMTERRNNSELVDLIKCAHLIVHFKSEGAVWIDNTNDADNHLIFDAGCLEGDWGKDIDGQVLGRGSCFTAGVVCALLEHLDSEQKDRRKTTGPDLARGIRNGLTAMRALHKIGYGVVENGIEPGFPIEALVNTLASNEDGGFSTVSIHSDLSDGSYWTLIDGSPSVKNLPLYGYARQVARFGPDVLKGIPYGKFGLLFTVDRRELESLNGIRQLINDYVKYDKGKKPLSIGVFGPPGAGKSFGIIEIVKGVLGEKVPILEFNLSQFGEDTAMLISALHQVRDKALLGITPVIFWDEFDSRKLFWLQYLLAPMQDGAFLEGQISHPIGKCIFVFAGGTRFTMESFPPADKKSEKYNEFKLKKGPDFVSRLRGYLNVLGPNPRMLFDPAKDEYFLDAADTCFPIRRALMLRVHSGVGKNDELVIDPGLLNAFLKIKEFKHGARSMETIIKLTTGKNGGLVRSNLPPREQIALHVNYDEFMDLIQQDMKFKAQCRAITPTLAERIHDFYLVQTEGEEIQYKTPFAELPAEIKDDNVAAAVRIPEVLSLVGLQVVEQDQALQEGKDDMQAKIKEHIEYHIELLAESEHNGWMQTKEKNGWHYGAVRHNTLKEHDCLLPYAKLSETNKEKDRWAVRNYQAIVDKARYLVVFEKGAG